MSSEYEKSKKKIRYNSRNCSIRNSYYVQYDCMGCQLSLKKFTTFYCRMPQLTNQLIIQLRSIAAVK